MAYEGSRDWRVVTEKVVRQVKAERRRPAKVKSAAEEGEGDRMNTESEIDLVQGRFDVVEDAMKHR